MKGSAHTDDSGFTFVLTKKDTKHSMAVRRTEHRQEKAHRRPPRQDGLMTNYKQNMNTAR